MAWETRRTVTLAERRDICDRRFADLQLGMILGRQFPQWWLEPEAERWDTLNGLIIQCRDVRLPWE